MQQFRKAEIKQAELKQKGRTLKKKKRSLPQNGQANLQNFRCLL